MRFAMLLLPTSVLLAGCASNAQPGELTPQPVAGKVTYDGKPAAGVRVTLLPVDAPGVPKVPQNPHAVTKADGTFAIGTFAEGDGAPEGGYQLVLSWPVDKDELAARAAKGEKVESSDEAQDADRLQGWYDPLHSTVNVRVKSGSNSVPTINIPKLTGPPPVSQGVPGRN